MANLRRAELRLHYRGQALMVPGRALEASPVNQLLQAPRPARDRRRPAPEEHEEADDRAAPRPRRPSPGQAPRRPPPQAAGLSLRSVFAVTLAAALAGTSDAVS
eukprot:884411-Alexandrium_andersonii.AAC.1